MAGALVTSGVAHPAPPKHTLTGTGVPPTVGTSLRTADGQILARTTDRFLASRWSSLVPIFGFVLAWQAAGTFGLVNVAFLPSPILTVRALGDLAWSASFWIDIGTTIARALAGLALGALAGVPMGAAMALSPAARGFFDPIIKSTYSLPKTALVPLLILWFGIGSTSNIFAVALSTVLPLVIYTYHGVSDAPRILVWSAQAMGTKRRDMLRCVFLPAAAPGIFTGLRIGLGFSLVIAIAAEMIAAKVGVGKLIFLYGENGAYDYMFAGVAAVVLIAGLADYALVSATRAALRWQDTQERG